MDAISCHLSDCGCKAQQGLQGMTDRTATILPGRGVLRAEGEDLRTFLQGIVSNDVDKVGPDRAIWSALLTPQGKFLHEFFIAEQDSALLLDGEAERLADLKRRLMIYKLRSKVAIEDASADFAVAALLGTGACEAIGLGDEPGAATPFAGGVAFTDPRLPALGARAIVPRAGIDQAFSDHGFTVADPEAYDRLRIRHGVPDGSRDLEVEKSILLENGFEELHGVDWDKGCFMGQELTARTKYRGLIKKRLLPVRIEGPRPEPGTAVTLDGKEVGTLRSALDDIGLVLLRLDRLGEDPTRAALTAGGARLSVQVPDWAILPSFDAKTEANTS